MTVSFEHFSKVVPNEFARNAMGLLFSEKQVAFLLEDEAHMIAFYDQWTRKGQPRSGEANDERPAAQAAQGAAKGAPEQLPYHSGAVTGFVFSMCAMFLFGWIGVGIAVSLVGAFTSLLVLVGFPSSKRRGRGLAIAGFIVGSIYLIPAVYLTSVWTNSGVFLPGAW